MPDKNRTETNISNEKIASGLNHIAELLEAQGENAYRVRAYHNDANTVRQTVVLYFEHEGREDQATVVTKTSDPMKGMRAVRGREAECLRYYERD